jgi:hypothetical protein
MRGPAAIKHNLPEDAADAEMAAANAFVEKANEAVSRQVGRRMPAAHGMFDEEDQRGDDDDLEEERGAGDDEENDAGSGSDDDGASGSEDEVGSERSDLSDEDDEDEATTTNAAANPPARRMCLFRTTRTAGWMTPRSPSLPATTRRMTFWKNAEPPTTAATRATGTATAV